jgi:Coenzyme PQQ synthesis protein D (PqqD)
MKLKKNLAFSDTGFVFNPSTGDSFSTNPIGLEILTMIKNGKEEAHIVAHIVNTYHTDHETVEKDLYDFTKMIQTLKLAEV